MMMYLYIDMHYAINVNYAYTTFLHRQNFSLSFQMGGGEGRRGEEERKREGGRQWRRGEDRAARKGECGEYAKVFRDICMPIGTWRMIFLQKPKRTDGQTKYRAKHQLLKSHNIEQTIRL